MDMDTARLEDAPLESLSPIANMTRLDFLMLLWEARIIEYDDVERAADQWH